MNPQAEKLRHAMSVVEIKWLQDNADTVAELVDAAMEVSWWATANHPDAEWVNHRLRRLARAVVDFKGPPSPPQPARTYREGILCPAQDCTWWIDLAGHRSADSAYRAHYRQTHQGGKS